MNHENEEIILNNSERRRKWIFDVVAVPLFLTDKNDVLIDINDRFIQTFGYTRKDVPTLNEWWHLAYPDPDYRQWVFDTWDAAMKRAKKMIPILNPLNIR